MVLDLMDLRAQLDIAALALSNDQRLAESSRTLPQWLGCCCHRPMCNCHADLEH